MTGAPYGAEDERGAGVSAWMLMLAALEPDELQLYAGGWQAVAQSASLHRSMNHLHSTASG